MYILIIALMAATLQNRLQIFKLLVEAGIILEGHPGSPTLAPACGNGNVYRWYCCQQKSEMYDHVCDRVLD